VLTDLNPWVVAFHLLFSMAIVSLAVLYLWRIEHPHSRLSGHLAALAWATYAAGWLVLALGTIVTGSGPHAGDATAPRNGLDPLQISQAHADSVFLLIGLSLGLLLALRGSAAPAPVVRAALVLVLVELGQGLIGFVQYFTDLPIVLVELHLLGAALIAATLTWVLLQVRSGGTLPE
jgi:cytochrome c oxidase assembly protein subunit 15